MYCSNIGIIAKFLFNVPLAS